MCIKILFFDIVKQTINDKMQIVTSAERSVYGTALAT